MRPLPSRQAGAALIVTLIMLALITLLAVTSFRLGKSNLQIVGNMQQRNQALMAAQGAIEQVISSEQFTKTPENAIAAPCGGPNTTCYDANGDGTTDVNVTVDPKCLSDYIIPTLQLSFYDPNDQGCLASVNPTEQGTQGAGSGNSLCANTVWDTQAVAADLVTGAKYVVDEGTVVRVPASSANGNCP